MIKGQFPDAKVLRVKVFPYGIIHLVLSQKFQDQSSGPKSNSKRSFCSPL